MSGVIGDVEGAVQQFAQHLGRARRVDVIDRIGRFGRSHVMRLRAHAADAIGQQRHFFDRPADAESFEAAQFGNLEVGIGDIAFFVQEDFDLAVTFETGNRINRDSLHVILLTPSLSTRPCSARKSEPARLKR